MRTLNLFMTISAGAFMLSSCDVKDSIYESSLTDHPEHGKITLTVDWSGKGAGIDTPAEYTVTVGSYTETLTQPTHAPNELFDPGAYNLYVYNLPGNPAVSGTVATADYTTRMPGWFFTSAQHVTVGADRVHELTAAMQQQVRQLTLLIEPTGSTADQIQSITASLSGAAGTLNFDNDTHGTPSDVALSFVQITEGADAGKWTATVRLLGVTGTEQKLSGTITFTDAALSDIPLESDLSAKLTGFNGDKKTPLDLGGTLAETPTGAGFTATITGWEKIPGSGIAN